MPIDKILEEDQDHRDNLSLVCNTGKTKNDCISSFSDSILIETADSGEQLNTSPFSSVDTQMPIHKISKEVETAGNRPAVVCNRGKTKCVSPSPDLVLAGASGSGERGNKSSLSSAETQMSICEKKKREEQVVPGEDVEEEEREREGEDADFEVVELDAVQLLAEHLHFCEICGKGFRRDANLRMHMRAHGDRFKSPGALAKPENNEKTMNMSTAVRFSCPYVGCNRNRKHKKFKALKSVICVKNHFKRSHCPKMYACDRCNKKSFSVLADLKSHLRHCGEARWRCSCGTSFSRKDKLFGHMALFEGHMPAVGDDEDSRNVDVVAAMEEDEGAQGSEKAGVDDATMVESTRAEENVFDDGFLERLGSIQDKLLQELLGTSSDSSIGIDGFFNF